VTTTLSSFVGAFVPMALALRARGAGGGFVVALVEAAGEPEESIAAAAIKNAAKILVISCLS
jgi:hypothetical protein